jgi:hypothetical protein
VNVELYFNWQHEYQHVHIACTWIQNSVIGEWSSVAKEKVVGSIVPKFDWKIAMTIHKLPFFWQKDQMIWVPLCMQPVNNITSAPCNVAN